MPTTGYTRPGREPMARRKGSARFDPYYKVQWFDDRSMAWRDVQASHSNADDARAAFLTGKRCRVMEITERGRQALA